MNGGADRRGQTRADRPIRLAYFVSHPIQYQTPLLRRIAAEPGIDLTVFFGSDFSVRGYRDEGFGVDVQWDVPLLDGYRYEVLPALRDDGTEGLLSPISHGIAARLAGGDGTPRFDAVWVHGYATANQMHAILAAKAHGIPVLLRSDSTLRDRPRGGAKQLLKRAFFSGLGHLVDGVLVSGTLNRAYWEHSFAGQQIPLFLLPYAVDNAWFQEQVRLAEPRRAELSAEFGLDPARPVILFASKLQTRKLCDDLVSAYAALCATRLGPAPALVIVGDGEERARLEAQAAATGLDGIRFAGFRNQTELPRFFQLAAVFVLPSRHEPWGLVVNEVMNAACPVIVTEDCGCQPDLVTDGVEGCVVPVRDVPALTAALERVLAPGAGERMGRSALARIASWDFEADVRGLWTALDAVCGSRRPHGAGETGTSHVQ